MIFMLRQLMPIFVFVAVLLLSPTQNIFAQSFGPANQAAEKSWNGGRGLWSDDAKWLPTGRPGTTDLVRIGDIPAESTGQWVDLSADTEIAGLEITNNGGLATFGRLLVNDDVTLGDKSNHVDVFNSVHPVDFEAQNLTIGGSSRFGLDNYATLKVHGVLQLTAQYSRIEGTGEVQLAGTGTTFVNNGLLLQIGESLNFTQLGDGLFDLDGTSSTAAIYLSKNSEITFSGRGLTDDANVQINMDNTTRLNMQLDTPWEYAGHLRVSNPDNSVFPARLTGADVVISNWIDVNTGSALVIDANMTATDTALLQTHGSGVLHLFQHATLQSGAKVLGHVIFHGDSQIESTDPQSNGVLESDSSGAMRIADGAILEHLTVENHGLLEVGNSPGIASVQNFVNEADGTWHVEIGGYDQYDQLVAFNNATLGGKIEVTLFDTGDGLFLPKIGDEFTILTALNNLSGAFLADPVSSAAGKFYHWTVLTESDKVRLRLDTITVPEPGAAVLAILGVVALGLFQRRRSHARR